MYKKYSVVAGGMAIYSYPITLGLDVWYDILYDILAIDKCAVWQDIAVVRASVVYNLWSVAHTTIITKYRLTGGGILQKENLGRKRTKRPTCILSFKG